MTTTTCTINGNVVSNYVVDADVQKNKVNNIGTCKIRLANPADIWGGTFSSNDLIALAINGSPVFAGKVDDVVPYLTDKGVYTNELLVTGTDYGRYGADFHFTKKYKTQPGGAILLDIFSMFGGANDPWIYADPGGTPNIKYEGKKTFLCEAVREICDLMAYDSYVDHANTLHIFASGTRDSTVDLISLVDDATNNLLSFDEFEQEGGDIKNIVEISAGNVKDHYTEENPTGYTGGGGGVVTSETTTHFIYGLGSIKLTCTGASTAYLDFAGTLYGYTGSVDLSPFCQAKVLIKGERGGAPAPDRFNFRPFLVDTGGKEIVFIRRKSGAGSKGITEDIPDLNIGAGRWSVITYPLGDHDGNPIRAAGNEMNGYWTFAAGSVAPFDWANVEQMGFKYPHAENGIVYIDGWTIPSLEAKYITADAGSRGLYDDRMYTEYRNELRSMPQLKQYGDRVLLMKRYPLVKFKAVAKGQVGTLYAAQYVHVRAPQHGVAALTKYIIVRLQHILRKKSDVRGFDFWTTYDLVTTDAEAGRVIRSIDPNAAMLAELRRQNRGFKGSMDDWDLFIGDIMTGDRVGLTVGASFPTDAVNEDMHVLTITITVGPTTYYPGAYRYDAGTATWEKASNTTLDGIDDGDFYGNVMHSRIHQLYMKTQHCKFEGESFDGVSITASPGYTLTDGLSYIKMVTDNDVDDNVILTGTGTSFSRQPSVDQIPLAFRARVRFTDPSTNFDMFLIMSASHGAQNGAFGWWIPAETGKLTHFWTKGGVWTTHESITPVRNFWYILEARFDPTTGIGFLRGSDENDYKVVIQDDTLTIDGDILPMWVSIHTKVARTATLEMAYWAATLDWRTL